MELQADIFTVVGLGLQTETWKGNTKRNITFKELESTLADLVQPSHFVYHHRLEPRDETIMLCNSTMVSVSFPCSPFMF